MGILKLIGIKIGPDPNTSYSKREAEKFCNTLKQEFGSDLNGLEVRFNGQEVKGQIKGLPPREILNFAKHINAAFSVAYLHGSAYLTKLLIDGRLDEDFFANFDCFVTHPGTYEDITNLHMGEYIKSLEKRLGSGKRFHRHVEALSDGRLEENIIEEFSGGTPIAIENEYHAENNLHIVSKIAANQQKELILDIGHLWRSFFEIDEHSGTPCDGLRCYAWGFKDKWPILNKKYIERLSRKIVHCHVHGIEKLKVQFEGDSYSYDLRDHVPLTANTIPSRAYAYLVRRLLELSRLQGITVELRKEYHNPPSEYIRKTMEFFERKILPKSFKI